MLAHVHVSRTTVTLSVHNLLITCRIRVGLVVGLSLASFLFVGFGIDMLGLVIVGVGCAGGSKGFGEITFLSLTARYDKSAVSGYSSGAGKKIVLG